MSGPRCHLASLLTIRGLLDEVIETMRKDREAMPLHRPASEQAMILGLTEAEQIRMWGT